MAEREAARRAGYQHRGRFCGDKLSWFDNRNVPKGDQFRYWIKKDGEFSKVGNEAMPTEEFLGLLHQIEDFLRRYGQEIYAGDARVAPYRYKEEKACDRCDYRSICRFDPWIEPYRVLKLPEPK
jgi:ATP-dependent helicase/DNAse subunit B